MARESREFEIVLWGATGFTGALTAEHLLRRHGVGGTLRWALGGRNESKLEAVRSTLARETGVDTSALPIIVGDGDDEVFLDGLTRRSRVICTTVGPYARYGSKLVAACAANGTDYCDLTGEVHWMQRMIELHEDAAAQGGGVFWGPLALGERSENCEWLWFVLETFRHYRAGSLLYCTVVRIVDIMLTTHAPEIL